MTARKQIKKRHRLERAAQQRAIESGQFRARLLAAGLVAAAIIATAALAFVFAPWSGSGGEAGTALPAISLSMGDDFFQPDVLTAQAGQKYELKIRNLGHNVHNVWLVGPNGKQFRSKDLSGGDNGSMKLTIDTPGEYGFVCTFHAGMGGRLTVQ